MTLNTHNITHDIKNRRAHSPFALLSLEPRYYIDDVILEQHYQILQETLHPDRFPLSSYESHVASQTLSLVNQAYARLKSPVERARALFIILGLTPPGDYVAGAIPTALIEEVFSLKERLSSCETHDHRHQLFNEINSVLTQLEDEIDKGFLTNDTDLMFNAFSRFSFYIKARHDVMTTTLHKESFKDASRVATAI
jgi:hypothetical protein